MKLDLSQFDRFAKTIKKGTIVFSEYEPGESFYLVQSGHLKIIKIFGTIEKIIDILKPGEFFGEMALLENAPRSASVIAEDDCKLLEFNRDNFGVIMSKNPQMSRNLLSLFAKRIYDQKRRLSILTLKGDDARVSEVFIMLAEQQGKGEDEDSFGKRVYTQSVEDIAHWAGITTEQCRIVLYRFQEQRRINMKKGDNIEVLNIHDMIRLVNSRRMGK